MNAAAEFVSKQIIYETMALDSGFSRKSRRDDKNSEMAFPRARRVSMARVQFRFVYDVEPRGIELDHQLFSEAVHDRHHMLLAWSRTPMWG